MKITLLNKKRRRSLFCAVHLLYTDDDQTEETHPLSDQYASALYPMPMVVIAPLSIKMPLNSSYFAAELCFANEFCRFTSAFTHHL